MWFEFQGIIFNGKKVLKFSQMLTVRPGGVSRTVKYPFFSASLSDDDDYKDEDDHLSLYCTRYVEETSLSHIHRPSPRNLCNRVCKYKYKYKYKYRNMKCNCFSCLGGLSQKQLKNHDLKIIILEIVFEIFLQNS